MRTQLLLGGGALLVVWLVAVLLCQPQVVVVPPSPNARIVSLHSTPPVHDLTRDLQEDGRATASELARVDRPLQCTCTQETCPHPQGLARRGHQETHLPANQTQFRAADGWSCTDRNYAPA